MPCTNDRRLLFIHIPKTGGTSIENAFGWFGPWKEENRTNLFGLIQSPDLLALGLSTAFLQHLTWHEVHQIWAGCDALSFAAVRNPWARFASVYANIDFNLKTSALSKGVDLDGLSFESFVEATDGLTHSHLRPQMDYLCDQDGVVRVNELLRTEQLSVDFQAFCSRHHLTSSLRNELPWNNRSEQKQSLRDLYSPSSWKCIADRYGQDLEFLKLSSSYNP